MNAELQIFLFGAVVALTVTWIGIRYQEYRKKKESFDNDFNEFRIALTDFTEVLWDKEVSLDTMVLQYYKVHLRVRNRFLYNLKGTRRDKFYKKWSEYEHCYEFAKSLGYSAFVASILPPYIEPSRVTEKDIAEYDYLRRKQIHSILDELITIANKKIWY